MRSFVIDLMKQSNGNRDEWMHVLELEERIKELHKVITEQRSSDGISFDAWYIDNDFVLRELLRLGQKVARELRVQLCLRWDKPLPNELLEKFKKAGKDPIEWEDGPDGAFAGLTILLAGWVANQSAAKARDNHKDIALEIFDNHTCPAIEYAKQYGKSLVKKMDTD